MWACVARRYDIRSVHSARESLGRGGDCELGGESGSTIVVGATGARSSLPDQIVLLLYVQEVVTQFIQ